MLNSTDSGQWVSDPLSEFEEPLSGFGHTIVGETTLVAAGGQMDDSPVTDQIVLLQPNTGRRTLSTKLPIGVRLGCSIAVNPTSKLRE